MVSLLFYLYFTESISLVSKWPVQQSTDAPIVSDASERSNVGVAHNRCFLRAERFPAPRESSLALSLPSPPLAIRSFVRAYVCFSDTRVFPTHVLMSIVDFHAIFGRIKTREDVNASRRVDWLWTSIGTRETSSVFVWKRSVIIAYYRGKQNAVQFLSTRFINIRHHEP